MQWRRISAQRQTQAKAETGVCRKEGGDRMCESDGQRVEWRTVGEKMSSLGWQG